MEKRYEENKKLIEQGKQLSELQCIYTDKEIEDKVKEMYPEMDEKEVYYNAHHVSYLDWLKVCNDEDELELAIKEQVEFEEDDDED